MVFTGRVGQVCVFGGGGMVFTGRVGQVCVFGGGGMVFTGRVGQVCVFGGGGMVFTGRVGQVCVFGGVEWSSQGRAEMYWKEGAEEALCRLLWFCQWAGWVKAVSRLAIAERAQLHVDGLM
jgi:hypothetical protein